MLIRSYLLLGAAYASASNLFITDYDGHLTSVKLSSESSDVYQLNKTIAYGECGANPTWSTVDIGRGVLYCLDEGFANDNAGALTSFSIKRDGQLAKVHHFNGLNAPVSAVVVGEPAEQQALVSANYGGEGGGSVSYFNLQCNGDFTFNDEIKFKHTLQPGQDEERQAASHPHQAIVDPTGQYVLVPDLGMDLVHIFGWDFTNHKLKQLKSLEVLEGTGPRHAAFWNPSGVACETCPTYFYLVSELAGTVTSYQVSYLHNGSGLTFRQVQISRTTGPHFVKQRTAPAEIVISVSSLLPLPTNDLSTQLIHP
jgi:6-phosphogluconolactonase (cycloisomerase 2 family)